MSEVQILSPRPETCRQSGLYARVRRVREHLPGVNKAAIREGNVTIGVKYNEIIVFSELMDATSLRHAG